MVESVLVSSCLLGVECTYDKRSCGNTNVLNFCSKKKVLPVCPEMLSGLGCPREKHEISGGTGRDVLEGRARVYSISGADNTDCFILGAKRTLEIATKNSCFLAVLKERSPSCGLRQVYSGDFDGLLFTGSGVTSALLLSSGINIISEYDV